MQDPVALRVATRFQREVLSTFIPDKWFKGKRAELVAALKRPIRNVSGAEMWAFDLDKKIGDFLTSFEDEFKSMVTYEPALESIRFRTEDAKEALKGVVNALERVAPYNYINFKDPVQYLKWYATFEIHNKIAESTKTLGGFFKWGWVIDEAVIDRLVQRTIKRATPEQLESLTSKYNVRIDTVRYNFLSDIGYKASSLKALKKTKITFDPLKWFDWTLKVIKSNYTEKSVSDEGVYREFDLYGMKVIIKDDTVTPQDIKKYIKYLDEVHAKMKIKGFEKAWYGNFYIECEKCGGVNRNTGGGVGGHFVKGPDTVSCFERPSWFLVPLITHELGHRYWFKQMTPAQRGKFESLVKVRPTEKRPSESDIPVFTIPEEKVQAAQAKIDSVAEALRTNLELFRKSRLRWFRKVLDAFSKPTNDAAWEFKHELISAVHSSGADSSVNQTVRKALLEVLELAGEVHTTCMNLGDDLNNTVNKYPDGTDFNQAFRIERGKWLEKTLELVNQTVVAAHHYVIIAVEATNEYESSKGKRVVEDWDRQFREDTRPVAPVSDYGGSNISEAFAEAFTHYVLELDMNRDQLESFKSVFSSDEYLVTLIAQRYLQEFS